MKNTHKIPKDFDSYQAWQNVNVSFGNKINNAKRELSNQQERLVKLRRRRDTLYENSSNIDKVEAVEQKLEDTRKAVKKQQKKLKKIRQEAKEAELQKQQHFQQFLEDVAADGCLESLVSEYEKAMRKVYRLTDLMVKWNRHRELKAPPPAELGLWHEGHQEDNISAFLNRMDALKNDEYKHRDLIQIEKSNHK